MTLDEAREHIGSGVIYENRYGPYEEGVITSVNDPYVFVLYNGQRSSAATYPADLKLQGTAATAGEDVTFPDDKAPAQPLDWEF